ncbi:MAG: type II toxin-antitoxin system prevent-host-death family antitoxin [Parasphingopyxis sp.]|uniref:type II toxin-antitoxin system Phd/YefM family antitoxin n=1 Tax=Parasphingopyxis sp. TaxID=1920299 RepID=UPI002628B184|nr:type II toxin-antitoxin system prevent-host-death family antitoxin [uncultured Parasphingopyxis sp.]
MDVVSYSDARKNLKAVMDRVVADKSHVVITRQKAESVVMLSLSDWNALEETAYLLASPANAKRLRESIAGFEAEGGTERELINPDNS